MCTWFTYVATGPVIHLRSELSSFASDVGSLLCIRLIYQVRHDSEIETQNYARCYIFWEIIAAWRQR